MHPWNVLVVPGGTEIGLEICSALKGCKEVNLTSAGQAISSHAPYVFAQHYILPSVREPSWLQDLNRLVVELATDFIIPAHDDVVVALAGAADRIPAKVVTSPLETCLIARSKRRTYAVLRDLVPCPQVYLPENVPGFPIFCKPDSGQGSHGARLIRNATELTLVDSGEILLEYLPGDEFTVDCFSDRRRGLLFTGGRKRIRVRNGISVATASAERAEFEKYAQAISSALEFHGAWFFQVKEGAEGALKLLEVAPRIAGAMAFHRVQGVNFPLLSLYESAGVSIDLLLNEGLAIEMDRALINRYRHNLKFDTVYVDLDDTLLVRGSVNLTLVTFLYQCVNAGVKIILLTKHCGDLAACLSDHRLAGLFDEVIHIGAGQEKADFIQPAGAILIDDSFSERRAVRRDTGLRVFDLSMLEMLIDHTAPVSKSARRKPIA